MHFDIWAYILCCGSTMADALHLQTGHKKLHSTEKKKGDLQALPPEILSAAFKTSGSVDLFALVKASAVIARVFKDEKHGPSVSLHIHDILTNSHVRPDKMWEYTQAVVERFGNIEELDLQLCSFLEDRHLTRLIRYTGAFDGITMRPVGRIGPRVGRIWQHLKRLNLSGCKKITDIGLEYLTDIKQLESLDLGGCIEITDMGLKQLNNLTQLRSLNLGNCIEITDTGLEDVGKLTRLHTLDLGGCKNITDTGLAHIGKITELRSLNLAGCKRITNTGLTHVAHVKKLTA